MKKTSIIIASIFYLLLSVGVKVNAHYCGEVLSSISFFDFKTKSCCGVKEVESKCCKDKVAFLKIADSHTENSTLSFVAPEFSELILPSPLSYFYYVSILEEALIINFIIPDAEPYAKVPFFISNGSLRV